jgi:hypothetical protein
VELTPITLPISAFCRFSGLSRQRVYDLLKAAQIHSITIGARRFILVASYREFLGRRLLDGQRPAAPAPKRRALALAEPRSPAS